MKRSQATTIEIAGLVAEHLDEWEDSDDVVVDRIAWALDIAVPLELLFGELGAAIDSVDDEVWHRIAEVIHPPDHVLVKRAEKAERKGNRRRARRLRLRLRRREAH